MEIDLSGKTAIVTGAGRGIGERIAVAFADTGANVVAAARTRPEIEATVRSVEECGSHGLAVETDVTDTDDVEALFDEIVAEFGAAEILVNNAGTNLVGPPLEYDETDVENLVELNFESLFILSQRFARRFRESPAESGRIINISSILARVGFATTTMYGGTKSGIYGITRGLAAELAQDGVTVNSISPGLIRTDRIEGILEEDAGETFDVDRIPLDRIGRREEIAHVCVFLGSPYASYITGEDILVDGGVHFTAGLYK